MALYLKKVEIQGFKSFADKTEIEFKDEVTAIVGPNGSGKSNISDAIRWVLGEQSVKNLRGSKMEDIIFSGTDSRRALGYAEVTIIFNNERGIIPIDYSEVAVTRRMFRSGESEFYINKNSCRLKDVRELFMDSGIGKDGYSIIGQGKIDEILSNRPEDRRNIFEEAAGIIKFRSKKEEAERKLEKTEANILRIRDLIHEVSKQKDMLQGESQKAERFKTLYQRLRDLEVNIFIKDIRKLEEGAKAVTLEKEKLISDLRIIEAEKIQIEENYNLLKSNIENIEKEIEGSRTIKFESIQKFESNRNEVKFLVEKENFLKKDLLRLKQEKNQASNDIEEIRTSMEEIEGNLVEIQLNIGLLIEERDTRLLELGEYDQKVLREESILEDEKNNIIKLYNESSDKRSQVNSINSLKYNMEKRIGQLDEEALIEEDKLEGLSSKGKELEREVDEISSLINKEKENLKNLKYYKTRVLKDQDDLNNLLRSQQMKLNGLESNFNLYNNMESSYEGYYKSVKSIMKKIKMDKDFKKGFVGIVADLLKVESNYAKAIDISLASSAQNLVVESESDAKKFVDFLKVNKSGRATFLPLNIIKGKVIKLDEEIKGEYNILGLGHELIEYDKRYRGIFEYLLGRTIIVKDMDSGIKLSRKQGHIYRIVTLEGEVLNPGGSISGGSYENESLSLISRKSKLEELKVEIEKLEHEIVNTEGLNKSIENKFKTVSSQAVASEERIKDMDIKMMQLNNSINFNTVEINRARADIEKRGLEKSSLLKEMDGFNTQIIEVESSYKKLQEEIEDIKSRSEYNANSILSLRTKRDEISKILTDLSIKISNLENSKTSMEIQVKNYKITKESIYNGQIEKDRSIRSIEDEINSLSIKKEDLEEQIKNYQLSEDEISKDLDLLIKKKENYMKTFYEEQDRLKVINIKISELEKQTNSLDVKLARLELQFENTHTRLLEDYELTFEEAVKFEKDIDSLHKSQTEVKNFKEEIKSLGNVNISAIEEFRHICERFEFTTKQHEDLVLSKENLREVIKDMEKQMKLQFVESFREINKYFTDIFSVLFNGGKAALELEDGEDILRSGIEIKVQPPGKKLQSLSLLSGGEKSLTAVALLFAILKTKPSPFCILDEIDAALDEANISRYTNYLKNIKEKTQFILITHRKTTMEIADVLYGVTMEEEGVSKLISIKLKDNLVEAS